MHGAGLESRQCDLSPLSPEMGTQISVSRADSSDKEGRCLWCPMETFLWQEGHRTCPGRERQPRAEPAAGPTQRGFHLRGPSCPRLPTTKLAGGEDINLEGETPVLAANEAGVVCSQEEPHDHRGRHHNSGSATRPRNGTGHKATPQPSLGGMKTGVEMAWLHLGRGNHNLGLEQFTPQPVCGLPNMHTQVWGAGAHKRAELAR